MVTHKYVEEATLSGHLATITTVAFSPDAQYLASASEDGVILVFSTRSWKPIRHFVDVSPPLALIWHPTFLNTIICGFKNGDVLTFCFDHGDRGMTHKKIWVDGLDGPVECIGCDCDGRAVALGHGNRVSLADQITISSWKNLRNIPDPPSLTNDSMELPKARSIHFVSDGGRLIVSFLDHGIVCYDLSALSVIWTIVPRTCNIGHSAISVDEKYIVVSNLYDGLDWYSIADRALSHTVQCPINQQMNLPVPVLFTRDGDAIIMGGTCGSARVLDASTSETVQTLPHSGDVIQAVDHCVLEDDLSLIAVGVSELGDETTIKVWVSKGEETGQTPTASEHQVGGPRRSKRTLRPRWLLDVTFGVLSILCLLFVARSYGVDPGSLQQKVLARVTSWSGGLNVGGVLTNRDPAGHK